MCTSSFSIRFGDSKQAMYQKWRKFIFKFVKDNVLKFKRLLKEIYGQVIDNNNDWPRFNLLRNV